MALQQYRVFRLVMVLVIVGLTIFLYASYYANPTMTIPGRMHTASALLSQFGNDDKLIVITNNELDSASSVGAAGGANGPVSTREDINGSYAQQYSDVSMPSSSYAQPSNTNNSKSSKDTITPSTRKGATNSSASSVIGTASVVVPALAANALSSSSTSPSQHSSAAAGSPALPSAANMDTLKGVRTGDLYEPGHSEANTELCPDSGEFLRLLILITSAPTHHDARLAIRQTWGHYATRRDISIGFVLGSTQTQAVEDALAAENYMYGDLIRGHFVDSYNNLTLKTISSLEWVDTYCQKVSFVLKTDDDMFINVPRLLSFMEKHHTDTNVIFGRLAKKWKPIRNKKSKYYVSPQQYFPPVFPQFTTGPAYLMSTDVVHGLYAKALNQTYLKLEDVFTTGIVAQLVNVKRVHVNEFLNRRIAFNPCNIRKAISVHMIKSNEQFDLWKKLLDTNTKCK